MSELEGEMLSRWWALSKGRLHAARHDRGITWVKGKRGAAWFHPTVIEDFIKEELKQRCTQEHPKKYAASVSPLGSQRS